MKYINGIYKILICFFVFAIIYKLREKNISDLNPMTNHNKNTEEEKKEDKENINIDIDEYDEKNRNYFKRLFPSKRNEKPGSDYYITYTISMTFIMIIHFSSVFIYLFICFNYIIIFFI